MATGLLSKGITLGYSVLPVVSYTNLPDLQDIPDLGGEVEKVETTTLSDAARTYINGIKDYGDLQFTFLYGGAAADSFRILDGLSESTQYGWQVELEDGTTFTFEGAPSIKLNGAGVNEALTCVLSIALSSDITIAFAA